jgi:EmrB/QacA subfamily drug resistance transporter
MSATASSSAATAALPRWRVFPALALGTVMATLDISVVNIALPTLSRRFGVSLTTIEWVVLAYVLTITGLLLTLGRVSDAVGRRRVYGIGLLVFVAASALCAAAPSAHGLIAARAVQGLGAAMMTANASALLIASFDPSERGRALGAFGAVVGVGLALGPPFGGLVVEHLSWRWIFAANLPLGLAAFAMLRARVPADVPGEHLRIDPLAASLWSTALIAVLLALSRGPDQGWGAPSVWGAFVAAAILLGVFVALQARAVDPLLPRDLRNRPFAIGLTLTLIGQALSIAVGFQMPQFLENVWGLSAAASGRWLAVLPMVALVLAPMAGRWSDQLGTRPLTMTGMALTSAGLATVAMLGVAPRAGVLVAGLALVGIGQALFAVANSSAILSTAPAARLGVASGLQATMRNLGIASGSAVTTALVATRFAAHSGQRLAAASLSSAARVAFASATRDAYLTLAAVALIAVGLAAATRRGA